ncbi:MAG TPA: DUF4345 family protein [Polyangia bacterium]|nr:DUF4345 family protein [Polyangia bacterium]
MTSPEQTRSPDPGRAPDPLLVPVILWLVGLGSVANALWMLAAPRAWYHHLPAEVPDFGPYNEHFIRDIGCAFLTVGASLAWAASRPALRRPLIAVGALFFGLHALLHIYDSARAFVPPVHWLLDLPSVYLPPALLLIADRLVARRRRAAVPEAGP